MQMCSLNTEEEYDEAYAYPRETSKTNEGENDKQLWKSKFHIVVISLLISSLVIAVASLVFVLVLFNGSQKELEKRLAHMEVAMDDLSTATEADRIELMRLKSDTSELSVTVDETQHNLNSSLETQQTLTVSLQSLSNEVTSELWVEVNQTRRDLQSTIATQQQVEISLQSLSNELSGLSAMLDETRGDLQSTEDAHQRLSTSLQSLSSQVTSYHRVEPEISCSSGYIRNPYANSCIRLETSSKSWSSAKSSCQSRGETLATFETLESQYWFINLRKTSWTTAHVWVGGEKSSSSSWRWAGREPKPIDIAVWAEGEPNNDGGESCMESFDEKDYKFNDNSCSHGYYYVCERST